MDIKKVKVAWVVALPLGLKPTVKVGDEVRGEQCLAEGKGYQETMISLGEDYLKMSGEAKKSFEQHFLGSTLNEGEVLISSRSILGKKTLSPITGTVSKIDEFGNMYVKKVEEKTNKLVSPVGAKVIKVDGLGITLEFRAEEYTGEGLNQGRVWVYKGLKYIGGIGDLSMADSGKVMITEKFYQAMWLKAEVVGIKGAIILDGDDKEKNDKIDTSLPTLALNKEKFERLVKTVETDKLKLLLDTSGSRLLLVV